MLEEIGFLISLLLGALIGLQREYEQQTSHIVRFAGLRTFILISFLGAILGYLSKNIFGSYFLAAIGFFAVIAFSLASYVITYFKYRDNTATTEIAAVLTYIIGLMTTSGFLQLSVIFGIIIASFLTFKRKLHHFAKKIKKEELFAIVEFGIISLVILPLLPRKNYSPLDIPIVRDILLAYSIREDVLSSLNVFNFYNIWLMVVLVAAIGFLGYILIKFLGTRKGFGLTGFVGGLVSSTAVALSMSGESKKYRNLVLPFVVAVIIASSTSYLRVLVEVLIVNRGLFQILIFPLGIMGLLGYSSIFLLRKKGIRKVNVKEIKFRQPFSLSFSVKFGLFFGLIIFASRLLQLIAGNSGLYITSILFGLADVDAVTLTMASLSAAGKISSLVATNSIVMAVSSNTLIKAGIAWFLGERKFAIYVAAFSIFILVLGLGTLFFL